MQEIILNDKKLEKRLNVVKYYSSAINNIIGEEICHPRLTINEDGNTPHVVFKDGSYVLIHRKGDTIKHYFYDSMKKKAAGKSDKLIRFITNTLLQNPRVKPSFFTKSTFTQYLNKAA